MNVESLEYRRTVYVHDVRVVAAFEHSSEYELLMRVCSRRSYYLERLLHFAATRWLEPDDINPSDLLAFLGDMPCHDLYTPDDIPAIIRELRSFWTFVRHEYRYPHADRCLRVLDHRAEQALTYAMTQPPPGHKRMRPAMTRYSITVAQPNLTVIFASRLTCT